VSSDIEFIKLDVQGRLAAIKEKLLEQDPMLPVHLSAIHSAVIQYEELVHILKDEDIKVLMAAQQKHVGVVLGDEITKSSKATVSKRIPKTSVDDL
jgi:hypothetical protein